MRELTKKQKIRVLNEMIKLQNNDSRLCHVYYLVTNTLNYTHCNIFCKTKTEWTPRFKELSDKIASELTGDNVYIHYKNPKQGRINLLKELKKCM